MACINLDLDFFDHPKTRRLIRLLGRGSEVVLPRLWCFCGKYHCEDGKLDELTAQEIETEACRWWGQPGKCVRALVECGFLDRDENGSYIVHDWLVHCGHIPVYRERARKAALKRWGLDASSIATSSSSKVTHELAGIAGASPEFLVFWQAYPKKAKADEAVAAWRSLDPNGELQAKILAAIKEQSLSPQWRNNGGHYIPNPANWLKSRRWEDEVSAPSQSAAELFAAKTINKSRGNK